MRLHKLLESKRKDCKRKEKFHRKKLYCLNCRCEVNHIELKSDDVFYNEMLKQAEVAVETADVILFFTDARQGMLSADQDVADYLRKKHDNIILVVNKVDGPTQEDSVYDFYSLGLGEPAGISALNMMGFGDLLDRIVENFPHNSEDEENDDTIKIAVVGKPNAGKSSLINEILFKKRNF